MLASSELLLELIVSGGKTLLSIYDLPLSVVFVSGRGSQASLFLGGYHDHLYDDQYQ